MCMTQPFGMETWPTRDNTASPCRGDEHNYRAHNGVFYSGRGRLLFQRSGQFSWYLTKDQHTHKKKSEEKVLGISTENNYH